jgi:defect-in-organelle-trafficking protein DotD
MGLRSNKNKAMNKQKNILLITLLASLSLSACAYVPKIGDVQLVAEPDTVDLMLADAADRSTRALETLAAMEVEKSPIDAIAAVPNAPIELQRAVTFNWTGPVEPLVEELARKSGYNYGVIGSQPSLPIIVSMNAINEPLISVFRSIGMQMGARADLSVNAPSRLIEIQYAETSNTNQGM